MEKEKILKTSAENKATKQPRQAEKNAKTPEATEKSSKKREVPVGKIIIYILLGIWALMVLFPFYWMIL